MLSAVTRRAFVKAFGHPNHDDLNMYGAFVKAELFPDVLIHPNLMLSAFVKAHRDSK